jgi:signal transduction histidine kinase
MAWAALVTIALGLLGLFGNVTLDWPHPSWLFFALGVLLVPLASSMATTRRFGRHGRAVLVATTVLAGLVGLVCALYLVVLVAFGRRPAGDDRELYALCLGAAILASALVVPASARLRRRANRWVYGEREDPEASIKRLGARMTRALPMDELLLQVVETLRKTLALTSAEVWTGEHGRLVRAASMPERGTAVVDLDPEGHHVAARAQAQGNAWLEMWLPDLLAGRERQIVRSVSIRHQGELLGLLVLERPAEDDYFTAEEDTMLVDLARQLGLALHNVRLDSALEASVRQLEQRNVELSASRARIVAVADESRRSIERDLHDGAQQHLVALAAKIGLIRSMVDAEPDAAADALDELAQDVTATIDVLRELAHGIYPPRLRDRGLAEALGTAAARARRPATVDADRVGRYAADVEAAVYFCCLEAIQNAEKHAGDGATVTVRLDAGADELRFAIQDDGHGFDPAEVNGGQGITNMRDRVGAIGGELSVETLPGAGTTVSGMLPARPRR